VRQYDVLEAMKTDTHFCFSSVWASICATFSAFSAMVRGQFQDQEGRKKQNPKLAFLNGIETRGLASR
jgi:hypothetical protein